MKLAAMTRVSRKLQLASILSSVAVIILVVFAGNHFLNTSSAARPNANISSPYLYLSPSSGRVAQGESKDVVVYVDSFLTPVNVVQVQLNYPSSKLTLDSISEGAAFPIIAATDVSTPGVVKLARSVDNAISPSVSGANIVATLHFKVNPTATRDINLSFTNSESYIVRASDSANVLSTSVGATFAAPKR